MNSRFFTLFTIVSVVLLLASCSRDRIPQAHPGILDLRQADLEGNTLPLRGSWSAHPGHILPPGSPAFDSSAATAKLPGAWKDLVLANSGTFPKYATFRLVLLLDTAKIKRLQISCTEHPSAYRLWVNGRSILEDGQVATSAALETPGYHYRRGDFEVTSPRVELVLQASNHFLSYDGSVFRFQIGSKEAMDARFHLEYALFLGALGILLFLTLQYLGFLGFLTKDRTYLLLGTSSFFLATMGIFIPAGFCFATTWWPWITLQTTTIIGFSCALIGLTLLSRFCEAMFPDPLLRTANRVNTWSVAVGVLLMVFAPYHWVYTVMGAILVSDYFLVITCCRTLFLALRRREPGSLSFTIGLGLFMVAAVHDSLIFFSVIDSSYIITLGCTAFSIAEAFVLTRRWWTTTRANTQLLSEVQAKNEELGRLSRLKDEFLANTSHELRTPLHGIYGLVQSILSDPVAALPQKTRHSLEHVVASTRRLTRLVNDILDFSKIRHKDLSIRPNPLDLGVLLPTLLPHFQANAEAKQIDLHCHLDPELPQVLADEDRLVQILFNLIGNAVKFTDWGSVTLSAQRIANGVEVAVTDTGMGIDRLAQERIFEPFEQAEGIHRGGTGLGLSITRHLVELHGFRMVLKSNPGEGSRFSFVLPESAQEQASPSKLPLEAPAQERSHPPAESIEPQVHPADSPESFERWVLAIDDEPVNLLVLRNLLNAQDIGVITAPDGRKALELIQAHDPEVVLLDVMMPYKDGYEVCTDIRRVHSSADLPVLFLSARSRLEDVIHGFTAGGNDYVLKPFLGQELVARVQAQMRQREAFRALRENRSLKVELADLALEKSQIELVKNRLTSLFHGMDEPILVVDTAWQIRFANQQAGKILSQSPEHLVERMLPELVEDHPSLPPLSSGSSIELTFRSNGTRSAWRVTPFQDGDEGLWALSQEVSTGDAPRGGLSRLVIQKLAQSEDRLGQLREQMDLLSSDLQMDLPIGDLQSTLSQIRSLVADQPDEALRLTRASELLNEALELWSATTGKSKADLAEESGLWAVHMDQNGWRRTATLDKYLDPAKIPKLPKWKTIFKTVEFVCRRISTDPRAAKLLEKSNILSSSGFHPTPNKLGSPAPLEMEHPRTSPQS
ncbi:MAG: response regulator [Fibrobacterota bacterium]|nr:response regulator [Fibrobacterota bacterium]QQS03469.1 MAG: response regulator [Fibrobacterota bacterium]